jgi:hypothetical protein
MNMNHWILWFNDYLEGIKEQSPDGTNHVILFKSCFFSSNIGQDGVEPGNPFSSQKTLVNYKAVYRHPAGAGHTYQYNNVTYYPLEDIFAANPDILFIPITAPPLIFGPPIVTNDAWAHRARLFNNWLKNEWLPAYNAAHPGLNNVAVFDLFNVLAYPDNHPEHPNRLRAEYGGGSGDSHPNSAGNAAATAAFASAPGNFLNQAWQRFTRPAIDRQFLPPAVDLPPTSLSAALRRDGPLARW